MVYYEEMPTISCRSGILVFLLWRIVSCTFALAIEPTHRDIEYARVGHRSLVLDLYQPVNGAASMEARPVVVWVHGGAWRSGSKKSVPVMALLDHGFAIASVEYRLSPEAKFPAQVHDIKAAIRFLRAHAKAYMLDSQRFVVAGASAGGHLAALVGVTNGNERLEGGIGEYLETSSEVHAIVSFYGASNLQSILAQSSEHGLSVRVPALQLLLGGQPRDVVELAKLASPVSHVDSHDPPLWLIHGDADPQMPIAQSEELSEAYRGFTLPVQFSIVPDGEHGGTEFYTDDRLSSLAKQIQAHLRAGSRSK